MNISILKAALFLFFIAFLTSCSSVKKPAPVVDIKASKPASSYKKGSLNSRTYKVKKGETLYSIAWRSNVDISKIAQINKLSPPYKIYPGQKIFLTDKNQQATSSKRSKQKSNKYSVKKASKEVKKPIDSKNKQEYGGSVSREKASKNIPKSSQDFSQKIRKWQWPANGKIVNFFSTKQEGNKGIDIVGRKGETIRAAANGVVVYAGDALRGYGNLVIIKHNDDYLSAYAHNDKIIVKEQQTITIGQKIAEMGNTDAKRVMLHFEVRFRGKSVNPMKYLPKK